MNSTSSRADAGKITRVERLQSWIAAAGSALLHLALLVAAMLSPPVTFTPPQGADTAAGGRMAVTFVDRAAEPPPDAAPPKPQPTRPTRRPRPTPAPAAPDTSRVQSTWVIQAEDPLPPEAPTPAPAATPDSPPDMPPDPRPPTTSSAAGTSPPRPWIWGHPPGTLPEHVAPVDAGRARTPTLEPGRRPRAASSGPSMEVGGYQVYYDLRSETRLSTWRDQGMTELFLPLPGTRQYMVCPLETALRRESGPCRLVEPDDPELASIGDAREAINMEQVYRRGELVWRGPGPYR